MPENKIEFTSLQDSDIPLLRQWLKEPHVAEFWQETEDEEEFRKKFLDKLPERGVVPFIISVNSKPVGYIQYYDACKVGGGWWPNAKEGTFGVDQFIGDPKLIGRGFGTEIIKCFVQNLFSQSKVKELITDPEPKNKRAIRAYEKVGFKTVGEIKTPGGYALLMRMERPSVFAVNQLKQRPSPYEIAKELLETRFKGAELVFAAGTQPAEHLLKFYQKNDFKIIRPIYYEGKTYCSWILEKPIYSPSLII
jgi:RimJ/RimL family protein N-acetyltransferase